ncbi:MAG: YeiH family protein [Marinicella sp.]
MGKYMAWFPGVLILAVLSTLTWIINQHTGVSSALLALGLGWLAGLVLHQVNFLQAGVNWSECHGLSVAVALLGLQLNFQLVLQIDGNTAILVILGMAFTFGITLWLSKWLKVAGSAACLLASGQGICGSAAIMGAQKIVQAPAAQVALMVGLVNILGVAGVLITTAIAHALFQQNPIESGHLIGNTLQSMGHVVAAGFSVNEPTGQVAVLIKMCRILLLIPVLLIMSFTFRQAGESQTQSMSWIRLVPLFVLFFLFFSLVNTMQWLPKTLSDHLTQVGDFLMLIALAGIGFNLKFSQLKGLGGRILLMGVVVFTLQILFSTLWIYSLAV